LQDFLRDGPDDRDDREQQIEVFDEDDEEFDDAANDEEDPDREVPHEEQQLHDESPDAHDENSSPLFRNDSEGADYQRGDNGEEQEDHDVVEPDFIQDIRDGIAEMKDQMKYVRRSTLG
jgi:hypothetical protein